MLGQILPQMLMSINPCIVLRDYRLQGLCYIAMPYAFTLPYGSATWLNCKAFMRLSQGFQKAFTGLLQGFYKAFTMGCKTSHRPKPIQGLSLILYFSLGPCGLITWKLMALLAARLHLHDKLLHCTGTFIC